MGSIRLKIGLSFFVIILTATTSVGRDLLNLDPRKMLQQLDPQACANRAVRSFVAKIDSSPLEKARETLGRELSPKQDDVIRYLYSAKSRPQRKEILDRIQDKFKHSDGAIARNEARFPSSEDRTNLFLAKFEILTTSGEFTMPEALFLAGYDRNMKTLIYRYDPEPNKEWDKMFRKPNFDELDDAQLEALNLASWAFRTPELLPYKERTLKELGGWGQEDIDWLLGKKYPEDTFTPKKSAAAIKPAFDSKTGSGIAIYQNPTEIKKSEIAKIHNEIHPRKGGFFQYDSWEYDKIRKTGDLSDTETISDPSVQSINKWNIENFSKSLQMETKLSSGDLEGVSTFLLKQDETVQAMLPGADSNRQLLRIAALTETEVSDMLHSHTDFFGVTAVTVVEGPTSIVYIPIDEIPVGRPNLGETLLINGDARKTQNKSNASSLRPVLHSGAIGDDGKIKERLVLVAFYGYAP